MALTSLPFYRKNQSLHDMETERPKSMEALRQAVVKAVDEVEARLKILEREFNGNRSHEAEIRSTLPAMKNLMDTFELTYINSVFDIQTIVEHTLEPSEVFKFDMQSAQTIKDYHRKLMDFMPGRFEDIMEDVERILKYMKAYCLSFSPVRRSAKYRNPYLETPIHYELKRIEFIKAIRMHLDNIHTMSREYKEQSGVKVKAFGLSTNELARACDCGEMPLFLIFPEACSNIRNACAGAKKWAAEDELFCNYLKHDIVQFETKRVEQDKHTKKCIDHGIHIDHVKKTTKREIDELEIEMKKMNKREKQLLKKIESLKMDIKIMETEIKEKEQERLELADKAEKITDWNEEDLENEKNNIAQVIANNRIKIPETKHKIEAVKSSRQKLVIDKRNLLNGKNEELKDLQKKSLMSQGRVYEERKELKRIEESVAMLKNIYMKKTSPDITKKIYNNMPVEPRNVKTLPRRPVAPPPKPDPLDRASKVVARAIKDDWPALYRSLPFYPPRGEVDKDQDVDKLYTEKYRGDHKMRAAESIDKWRRVHSLANINSLKETLAKMNRNDIVDEIEMKPVVPAKSKAKKKARQNWDRLFKFKATLGKIMELQAHVKQQPETISQDAQDPPTEQSSPVEQTKRVHFATKNDILGSVKRHGKRNGPGVLVNPRKKGLLSKPPTVKT